MTPTEAVAAVAAMSTEVADLRSQIAELLEVTQR